MYLTKPSSNCLVERSFSKLYRVKNKYRLQNLKPKIFDCAYDTSI